MRAAPPAAKVSRPRLIDLIPRARLHQRLDALRRAHAVPWIAAPAGSGKTALIVGYVEQRRIPTIWYRVDEGDRDAEDLFFHLRVAAERFERSRRAGVELPSFFPRAELGQFSRRFFEDLFARLPAGALLVLDDYQLAPEDSSWQSAIEKGIGCVPPGMNMLVASRRPPPSALARPCVHGDLGLLDAAELFLTERETIAFGESRPISRQQPRRTRAELREIHAMTGGWVAGVSLLLRQDRRDDAPMLTVGAEVQPIFDYFASSVFSELTADAQRLLLRTACLSRFSDKQAESLSGVAGARAVLMSLYRSGFFIERDADVSGTRTEAFRCHPLFRSFLAFRAAQTLAPTELRSIRARAAVLLKEEGRSEEAFDLFTQIDDRPGLRQLVLDLAPGMFAQGRVALLERWLTALPPDLVAGSGWLEYWRSRCSLMTSPSGSRAGFERALELFERKREGGGAYLAWAGAVQALTYEGREWGAIERWLEHLVRIETFCPAFPSPDVGSEVASSLLMGLTLAGADAGTVGHWAERALSLAENANDVTVRVMTTSVLMLNYALRGDSGQAGPLVARLGGESESSPAGFLARVASRAAITALSWHRGDALASLAAAREGLDLMGARQVPMWQSALLVFGSWAALDRDDLPQVRQFLRRLRDIAESGTPLEVSAYHVVRAREALARADLSAALVALELSLDRARAVGFTYGIGVDLLILAYVAFERGERERGRQALAEVLRIEEEARDPVLPYWRQLIEADRALRDGERTRAIALLAGAFAAGQAGHLYGAHCPGAGRLADLCRLAVEEGIEPEYARTLIQRRRLAAEPPPFDLPEWPWPIRIRTLGSLEVVIGDGAVPLGRSRTSPWLLKTVAALGLGGRGVTAHKVLSALWPDADGDRGMQVFEVTLSRLRKLLGPDGRRALRLERGRIFLDRSLCWTDLEALEVVMADVARLITSAGAEGTDSQSKWRSRLERVLALYSGPFVGSEEAPAQLVAFERRLRSRVAATVLAIGEGIRRSGGDPAAVESASLRALEADPGLDQLLTPAVRALIRKGHRKDARALVDLCRQAGGDSDEAARLL